MSQKEKVSSSHDVRAAAFREIPSVGAVSDYLRAHIARPVSDETLVRYAQSELHEIRESIERGEHWSASEILNRISTKLSQQLERRLIPVINATGILVHTNLGRAPVSSEVAAVMASAAANAVPLEIEAETNRRGGRMAEISRKMRILTGAERTLAVNNNAAAVLLVLSAMANKRDVIVSRGEAVEIGGGFRIPDVLEQSGARLVEIGTTNRTYASDFERAITSDTALMLKVHRSNFRIEGFTAEVDVSDLAPIAIQHRTPLVYDQGSGAPVDVPGYGRPVDSTIRSCIDDGCWVVTASGDKLLGGPQAGLICGRGDLVDMIARHPLARAVRADKTTLAGIAATLDHYLAGEAATKIPIWQMLRAEPAAIESRARTVASRLQSAGHQASVVETESTTGGGSLPGETVPSWAIVPSSKLGEAPDVLAERLRLAPQPVFGRVSENQLLLDLRSVLPEDDELVGESVLSVLETDR